MQGIVGLEVRNQPMARSEVTAISQQNHNLSGQVTLNTPDVDPSRELVEQYPTPAKTLSLCQFELAIYLVE